MGTKVECPECGSMVEVPVEIDDPFETTVGCLNTEEHEDGNSLVMYPVEEDDDGE